MNTPGPKPLYHNLCMVQLEIDKISEVCVWVKIFGKFKPHSYKVVLIKKSGSYNNADELIVYNCREIVMQEEE